MVEALKLHERLGRQRIADRIATLNAACKDELAKREDLLRLSSNSSSRDIPKFPLFA